MAFDSSTIRPAIGNLPEINQLEDRVAFVEEHVTAPTQVSLDSKPDSGEVDLILVLTQAAYDLVLVKDARTMYVVVG